MSIAKNSLQRLLIILALMFAIGLCLQVNNVYADDITYDASVNGDKSVTVTLEDNQDETYNAVISGTGEMKDYTRWNSAPWKNQMSKIATVTVESGVTHLGDYSFSGATILSQVTLNEGLQTIGSNVITNCNLLETLELPKSVESVAIGPFSGCDNLVTNVLGNNTLFEMDLSTGGSAGKSVIAYEDSLTAMNWVDKVEQEPFPDAGFTVEFTNPTKLIPLDSYTYNEDRSAVSKYLAPGTDIVVPDSVRTIGESTYENNQDLVAVDLNKVKTVNANAFKNCTNLQKVMMPSSVETIDESAFAGCNNVVFYGNNGSVAKTFADENGFDFVVVKPYKNESFADVEKEMPIGKGDVINLKSAFKVDYDTELKYQVKAGEGDYQDLEGSSFEFPGNETGVFTFEFRVADSYGEVSDGTVKAKYTVVANNIPVRAEDMDGVNVITTLGRPVEIDITSVFSDPDGDELQYKVSEEPNEIEDEINWDTAAPLRLNNGKFTTPRSWTLFANFGVEQKFYIKAFDKWDMPSKDSYVISLTLYSTIVHVNKGPGVHDLSGVGIEFTRDGADPVTQPAAKEGNNYYFVLDCMVRYPYGPNMPYFNGGYDYTYKVSLDGCEDVTGNYTTATNDGTPITSEDKNIIDITLTNPQQAEQDTIAVNEVKSAIDNLGPVTLENETTIIAAQEKYEALHEDLKPLVTNYLALADARIEIAELKLQKANEDKEALEKELKQAIKDKNAALKNAVVAFGKPALKTVKGAKKKMTVTWKKLKGAKGYEIVVAKNKKGTKAAKTYIVKGNKAKKVIKKLKKGKYFVKVRAYKYYKGNTIYSKYSAVKSVKVK